MSRRGAGVALIAIGAYVFAHREMIWKLTVEDMLGILLLVIGVIYLILAAQEQKIKDDALADWYRRMATEKEQPEE